MGLGNWKIQSIQSDNSEILEYEIPYHVHNDFLEIFTELGIIGFVLFFPEQKSIQERIVGIFQ